MHEQALRHALELSHEHSVPKVACLARIERLCKYLQLSWLEAHSEPRQRFLEIISSKLTKAIDIEALEDLLDREAVVYPEPEPRLEGSDDFLCGAQRHCNRLATSIPGGSA